MPIGKELRARRWCSRGRTVIVALDHGNAAGIVRGLEDPLSIVKICDGAGADGVLITPGVLEQVHGSLGNLSVFLRLDGAVSTAGPGGPMRLFCDVQQAVKLGADAAVVNCTVGAAHEAFELEKVGRVSSEGRDWGLPVVAEMLSERMMANHMDMTGAGEDELPEDVGADVGLAARLGAELGADAIKTRYSGDRESFRRIVASVGRPILVAGGPMRDGTLASTLGLVDEVLEAGASGVIFGRNVWQHPDPAEALRAICAMVHDDATVEEAIGIAQV